MFYSQKEEEKSEVAASELTARLDSNYMRSFIYYSSVVVMQTDDCIVKQLIQLLKWH
jgi:hypothetical protein